MLRRKLRDVVCVAGIALGVCTMAEAFPKGLLQGTPVATQENFINTLPGGPHYMAPDGSTTVPEMMGSFASIALNGAGNATGMYMPQPAIISNPADPRSAVVNPDTGVLGQFGTSVGGVLDFNFAVGSGPVTPGSLTGFVWDLTPRFAFGVPPVIPGASDSGLAPGSVAGDGIQDETNFAGAFFGGVGVPGDTVSLTTIMYGGNTADAGGAGSALTPKFAMYEDLLSGGVAPLTPFDLSGGNGVLLNESEFNHHSPGPGFSPLAPTGAPGIPPLADGADGDLALYGEIRGDSVVTQTFTLDDVNGDGIWNIAQDQVLVNTTWNSTIGTITGGSLVDQGKIKVGTPISLGFQVTEQRTLSLLSSFDDNGTQFDFGAFISPPESASGNASFFVIPEPATASLALMALAGIGASTMRRRRA